MKVKTVCIVGGGSSGWMTAAALAKNMPDLRIMLIESPNVPTLGVGESTLGHINRYLYSVGMLEKDYEWMPACDATYKVSIQFTDFKEKGHSFQYPFGEVDATEVGTIDNYYHLIQIDPDYPLDYSQFHNPITYLTEKNKMVGNRNIIRNFDFKWDTAYHFDAIKFGNYLRDKVAIPNGVIHIKDDVIEVIPKQNGEGIDCLLTKNCPTMRVEADLFIDCTGFKSLLLEQACGSKFISFESDLLNDRAIACRLPYTDREKEMVNYTDCHALSAGWVWETPLWNIRGTGYVHSSKFISLDGAKEEFRNHLATKIGKEKAEELEFRVIDMKHGKREKAWVGNCVGIGLSYGFLEPLESTGLYTTHENILNLIDTLERRNGYITKIDRDGFNYACNFTLESMRSFVAMHYVLSQRRDSAYWRHYADNIEMVPYEKIVDDKVISPRLYKEFLHNVNVAHAQSDLEGTLYIASGLGYNPIGRTEVNYRCYEKRLSDADYIKGIGKKILNYRDQVYEKLKNAPTTFEFTRDYVYERKDKT